METIFTPQLIKLQSVSRKNKTRLNCEFDLKITQTKEAGFVFR